MLRGNVRFHDPNSSVSISLSCLNNTVGILSREAPESCARYQSAATSASCSVPTASTAALICDTGALLDYLVESAPDHRLFRNAIDQARTRYVPALVLEVSPSPAPSRAIRTVAATGFPPAVTTPLTVTGAFCATRGSVSAVISSVPCS